MKLAELQRLMAADVMRPMAGPERISRENRAASYVKPTPGLTSSGRLEIYNRS
jgi:hypothetical protein